MTSFGGGTLEHVLLFMLVIVAFFAAIAQRIRVPYPILLVLGGLALSFLPHAPRLPLSPDFVFNLVLPPLLYAAAWQTNWREFRRQLVPISMLATGLVFFTVFGIAFFADRFITALDFKSGFLLGAIIAATDAVAATSIARTLGLERRIVAVIEGESLLNDATALLALELGLQMLLNNQEPHLGASLLRLVWLAFGGVFAGLLLAKLMTRLERFIDGGALELVISLIVPYVAYLAAEEIHASGVLAVVACGLMLSRRSSKLFSAGSRLQLLSTWDALDFLLNGSMFALIGLQLPTVLDGIREYSTWQVLKYGLAISVLLIALRLVWVFPGAHVARWIRIHVFHEDMSQQPAAPPRAIFIVGWTGMRGVVSLAAALSLPVTLSNGQPFAQRNLIIFLTFSVIFVTLVIQGLGMPPMIRALGMAGDGHEEALEFSYAMRVTAESAIQFLQAERSSADEHRAHIIDDLLHKYQHQLEAVRAKRQHVEAPTDTTRADLDRHLWHMEMLRRLVGVEREALGQLRDSATIGDEVARRIERNLDLTESRFTIAEE